MQFDLPKLQKIDPGARLLARPSWNDAALMLLANEWTWNEFTTLATTVETILPPNPRRWGVAFTTGVTAALGTYVSPRNRPDLWGDLVPNTLRNNFYTIFNNGPFIQNEWYVYSLGVQAVGIVEIEIGSIENNDSERI